ncbi:hypothetical protein HIM_11815 [Hirsutella minnesotensis 3608]|uniref:Uncharacterized protein n=1 Tax=Hirsutella minnesotensis 3608 TaxID=1043627 RepID=A0A0F7ZFA4_9HYPO|nr:hypothetical protein HIM_11815 [Hirsutella minnesotensis 3608]
MNDAELRAKAQTILSVIHKSRPKTTTLAYGPKQEEFEQFCQRKQYCDGATVTEEKLLLFLVEEVAGRPLKVRSRKAASDTPQDETRLGTYVTAVTDLYRTHKALGMNTHPSPREDTVTDHLITGISSFHHQFKRLFTLKRELPIVQRPRLGKNHEVKSIRVFASTSARLRKSHALLITDYP